MEEDVDGRGVGADGRSDGRDRSVAKGDSRRLEVIDGWRNRRCRVHVSSHSKPGTILLLPEREMAHAAGAAATLPVDHGRPRPPVFRRRGPCPSDTFWTPP